jgi:hypothetical protein
VVVSRFVAAAWADGPTDHPTADHREEDGHLAEDRPEVAAWAAHRRQREAP